MPGQVQAFVDRNWVPVLRRIESWRANATDRRGTLDFVRSVTKDWEEIPLEEKQIAYVPLEHTFWAALTALDLCATPRDAIRCVDGELPEDYEAQLAERLEIAYSCMTHRQPLPEGVFVARRHLP